MRPRCRIALCLTLAIGLVVASIGVARSQVEAPVLCARTAYDGRYCVIALQGWRVYLNADLATRFEAFSLRVVDLLDRRLNEAARVLPAARLKELRRVPVWIEDHKTGATSFYHPAGSPRPRAHGHPEAFLTSGSG
jgi:hypothetical protein